MGVRCLIDGGTTELTAIGSEHVNATGGALIPHADTEDGDLLVLLDVLNSASPLNTGKPSGWEEAFSFLVQTDCRLRCHVALATAGIISSGVLPLQSSLASEGAAGLYTFRPDIAITGFSWSGSPEIASSASALSVSNNLSVAGSSEPLVIVSLGQSPSLTAALSSTPAFDLAETFGSADFAYAIENSSPADHAITYASAVLAERSLASTWISVY